MKVVFIILISWVSVLFTLGIVDYWFEPVPEKISYHQMMEERQNGK